MRLSSLCPRINVQQAYEVVQRTTVREFQALRRTNLQDVCQAARIFCVGYVVAGMVNTLWFKYINGESCPEDRMYVAGVNLLSTAVGGAAGVVIDYFFEQAMEKIAEQRLPMRFH